MNRIGVLSTLEAVVSWLGSSVGQDAVICGAARRGNKEIKHTDLVIEGPLVKALDTIEAMCNLTALDYTLLEGGSTSATLLVNQIQMAIHVVTPESWGASILYYTGNPAFRISLAAEAKCQGYKLNSRGLWYRGEIIAGRSETQILDVLDLAFVPPEDRNFRMNHQPLRRKGELHVRTG